MNASEISELKKRFSEAFFLSVLLSVLTNVVSTFFAVSSEEFYLDYEHSVQSTGLNEKPFGEEPSRVNKPSVDQNVSTPILDALKSIFENIVGFLKKTF